MENTHTLLINLSLTLLILNKVTLNIIHHHNYVFSTLQTIIKRLHKVMYGTTKKDEYA